MLVVVGTCWPGSVPMSDITQWLYVGCCRYVLARLSLYDWYNPGYMLIVVCTCWPDSAPMSGITLGYMLIVIGTCWPGSVPMSGITHKWLWYMFVVGTC